MIRDVHPGSLDQKSTESRIRNIAYLECDVTKLWSGISKFGCDVVDLVLQIPVHPGTLAWEDSSHSYSDQDS